MRDWFTKDTGWKLFSVLLAVTIWLTVYKIRDEPALSASSGVQTIYGNLTVLAVSAASDVRDVRVMPSSVTVQVSGPPQVMAVLQANQIHAVVDLTGSQAVSNLKQRVEVSAPPGVTLISVDPPEVDVIFPPASDKKP